MIDNDLIAVLDLELPSTIEKSTGFLEITGQEQKEVVNTKVYAYFLNQTTNPELAELFMVTLTGLIARKTNRNVVMSRFRCALEEPTITRKRIDLLIRDESSQSAIIIENKLNHHLNNDLKEYYDHVTQTNKIGVLLTLEATKIPEGNQGTYVNITHKEWIDAIKLKGLPAGLSHKMYVYLNDFFETIAYLTVNYNMNEQVKFFFNYPAKINKAKECYDQAYQYVLTQLQLVADNYELKMNGTSVYTRYIWDFENKTPAYYLFDFENLLKDKKQITIIIELYDKATQKVTALDAILAHDPHLLALDRDGYHSNSYWHYAKRTYTWQPDVYPNLSEFLIKNIDDDFQPVMVKILGAL